MCARRKKRSCIQRTKRSRRPAGWDMPRVVNTPVTAVSSARHGAPRTSGLDNEGGQRLRRSLWTVLALAFALLAGTVTVFAQGTFYREVEKDGRIYVFNNMQQYSD